MNNLENAVLTMLTKNNRDAVNDPDAQEIFKALMSIEEKIQEVEEEKRQFMESNNISGFAYKIVESEPLYRVVEKSSKL